MILKKKYCKPNSLERQHCQEKNPIRVKGGLNPTYFSEFSQVIKKSSAATYRRGIL